MKTILFDTDLGGDCDDVLALDLLTAAHCAGECELIGVTYSADVKAAPDCIRAILKQHSMEQTPLGRRYVPDNRQKSPDIYASAVAAAFPDPEAPRWEELPEASRLLRRLLTEREHVTLVVTGFLSNVAALLRTGPDDLSPLTGEELVARRVDEIAVMGCNFSHQSGDNPFTANKTDTGDLRVTPEYNIVNDIPAARYVFEHCPVPLTVCPFEVGYGMITGKPMVEAGGGRTPDSLSYITFGAAQGRDSWDPATALYGVYGCGKWFYRSAPGRVTITERGESHFDTLNGGTHRILTCATPREKIAEEIDRQVSRLFDTEV